MTAVGVAAASSGLFGFPSKTPEQNSSDPNKKVPFPGLEKRDCAAPVLLEKMSGLEKSEIAGVVKRDCPGLVKRGCAGVMDSRLPDKGSSDDKPQSVQLEPECFAKSPHFRHQEMSVSSGGPMLNECATMAGTCCICGETKGWEC